MDAKEAEKFLEEWKEGFDKLFEAGGDMPTVTEEAKKFETAIASIFKSRVLTQKVLGVAAYQVAEYGTDVRS